MHTKVVGGRVERERGKGEGEEGEVVQNNRG
jgi:hypothetical protein